MACSSGTCLLHYREWDWQRHQPCTILDRKPASPLAPSLSLWSHDYSNTTRCSQKAGKLARSAVGRSTWLHGGTSDLCRAVVSRYQRRADIQPPPRLGCGGDILRITARAAAALAAMYRSMRAPAVVERQLTIG